MHDKIFERNVEVLYEKLSEEEKNYLSDLIYENNPIDCLTKHIIYTTVHRLKENKITEFDLEAASLSISNKMMGKEDAIWNSQDPERRKASGIIQEFYFALGLCSVEDEENALKIFYSIIRDILIKISIKE